MTHDGRWLPDVEGYAVRLQDGLVAFYPLVEDAPHYMRRDVEPTVVSVRDFEKVYAFLQPPNDQRQWNYTKGPLTLGPKSCSSKRAGADEWCTREAAHPGNHYNHDFKSEWEPTA